MWPQGTRVTTNPAARNVGCEAGLQTMRAIACHFLFLCLPPSSGESGPKGRKGVIRLSLDPSMYRGAETPIRRYAPPSPEDGGKA